MSEAPLTTLFLVQTKLKDHKVWTKQVRCKSMMNCFNVCAWCLVMDLYMSLPLSTSAALRMSLPTNKIAFPSTSLPPSMSASPSMSLSPSTSAALSTSLPPSTSAFPSTSLPSMTYLSLYMSCWLNMGLFYLKR